jgi:HK97 family phage major capsid protein
MKEDQNQPQSGETPDIAANVEKGVVAAFKNFFSKPIESTPPPVDGEVKAKLDAQEKQLQAQAREIEALKSVSTPQGVPPVEIGDAKAADKAAVDKFISLYVKRGRGDLYEEFLEQHLSKAAMNVTTDGQGGYLVPTPLYDQIVMPMITQSYVRRTGRATIQTSPYVKQFQLDYGIMSGAAVLTAEANAYDQKEPTVGRVNFTPYKPTKISKVSQELIAGSIISIDMLLGQDAAQAFAKFENTYFTTGTGSSQPQGITVGAAVGVTAASPTAITGDEIQDLVASVDEMYRMNGAFMMSTATMVYLKKLKIGTGRSDYLWDTDLSGRWSMSLFGYPVFINESMPSIATTNKPIVFGDFSYFWIMDFANSGLFVQRLNELYAATGQIGFAWHKYVDSRVVLSDAIKTLQMA